MSGPRFELRQLIAERLAKELAAHAWEPDRCELTAAVLADEVMELFHTGESRPHDRVANRTVVSRTRPVTLAEFLTARWDEIEAAARPAAKQHIGRRYPERLREASPAPNDLAEYVLADLASKRAILAEYAEAYEWYTVNTWAPAGEFHGLHKAVLLLAAPFKDHPDFDPSWSTG